MRVSNVSGESEPVTDLTALNQDLLQTISHQDFYLDEALDEKKYDTIFRYLWSWVLVFDFFQRVYLLHESRLYSSIKER